MAGETKIKEASHSKTLFTDDHNAPIIFFMRPCSERQFLRPLIEVAFISKLEIDQESRLEQEQLTS